MPESTVLIFIKFHDW